MEPAARHESADASKSDSAVGSQAERRRVFYVGAAVPDWRCGLHSLEGNYEGA